MSSSDGRKSGLHLLTVKKCPSITHTIPLEGHEDSLTCNKIWLDTNPCPDLSIRDQIEFPEVLDF